MYRRFVILLALLGVAGQLSAADLSPQIQQLINAPVLQNAWWAGAAQYAGGKTLFAVDGTRRMTPASTLKLLTTAAALDMLGPHHRFETRIYTDGLPDENGVLQGNVYIRGGGDPTLGSTRVKGSKALQTVLKDWARAFKKAGIKKINGKLYADVSLFDGPYIPAKVNWENIGNYFAAPATALAINDNSFRIFFKQQRKHQAPVQVEKTFPKVPGLEITSFVTSDAHSRKDNAYVYAAPYQYNIRVYGSIPSGSGSFHIGAALPDAPLQTLQWLAETLQEEGISVQGTPEVLANAPEYTALHLLHTEYSPELKDIILIVNKRSFNFYAEMLLRQLAVKNGQKGTVENGVNTLTAWLQQHQIDTENIKIYDGSGLSRDNLISARTLVDVLNVMSTHPDFNYYYKSLATPDDRGDLLVLRWFLRPRKKIDRVRIKGGTIDGVKAVAGYVTDEDGKLISFALIANNLISKDENLYRIHENIIKLLLQQPAQEEQSN